MIDSNRPPTEKMIKKLRNCLKRELEENKPFLAEEMKSSMPGLYRRGLIITKMENIGGKRLLCIYASDRGKKYLKELDND